MYEWNVCKNKNNENNLINVKCEFPENFQENIIENIRIFLIKYYWKCIRTNMRNAERKKFRFDVESITVYDAEHFRPYSTVELIDRNVIGFVDTGENVSVLVKDSIEFL